MSDWLMVVVVFWVAYLVDGLRRSRRTRLALVRAFPGPTVVRQGTLQFLPPLPWASRFWADDPPFVFSPEGICNQPLGVAGRPVEPAIFTAVWRWEEIGTVAERDGWLEINGRPFCPAAPAWPAGVVKRLAQDLLAGTPEARAGRLQRELALQFRPAHWARRQELVRRVSRWPVLANTLALLAFAALSPAAFPPGMLLSKEVAERLVQFVPGLLAAGALAFVVGVVLAVLAARRLRRWLVPGTVQAILVALLFPPQGLRWRRVLTDAMRPAPHPLLLVPGRGGREARRELAFATLTDLRWPLPLPLRGDVGRLAEAAAMRKWYAAEFEERVLAPWLAQAGLKAEELLAAPVPDGAASCAYCPRCGSQFVRMDGSCPRGIALVELKPRTPQGPRDK